MSRIRSARWTRSVLLRLSALAVTGLGLNWGGTGTTTANAAAHGAGTLAAPRLISLTYGRYRPQGALHSYLALRLTALEPHGQIVGTQFSASRGETAIGDGGCGLGGRRSGQVETFYIPFKLSSGVHEVTVTAVGSTCTSSAKTRTATRTFRVEAH